MQPCNIFAIPKYQPMQKPNKKHLIKFSRPLTVDVDIQATIVQNIMWFRAVNVRSGSIQTLGYYKNLQTFIKRSQYGDMLMLSHRSVLASLIDEYIFTVYYQRVVITDCNGNKKQLNIALN